MRPKLLPLQGETIHVTPLFAELNWQKLEKLILEKDIVTIYKIINEETYSENLKSLVESRAAVSARRTRAVEAGQLQLPQVRTECARRFFMYRAVASWNGTTVPPYGRHQMLSHAEGGSRLGFR